jgi:hypothetical protein
MACRLFRKAVQQGRSEPLIDARTMPADFVNSLPVEFSMLWAGEESFGISCKKFGSVKHHELEQLIDDYKEGEG